MALRGLVEGECGAANPLVQWTSHFSQDKSMLKSGLQHDRLAEVTHHGDASALEEQMVGEFLGSRQPAVPQTFHMGSLLEELQATQQPPLQTQRHPVLGQEDVRMKEWVEEFASTHPHHPTTQAAPGPESSWVHEFERHHDAETRRWVEEFAPTEDEKWAAEFEQEVKAGKDLAAVAREMADGVTDPGIQATEFMDFVKQLGSGELTVEDNQVVAPGNSKDWADQFSRQTQSEDQDFWERLEREWNEMAKDNAHPWLSDWEKPQEYQFEQENPLRGVANPLEEGIKRLKEGDLPTAVLLFEAEVQARPTSVQGWQYLGTTQADNEQELAAIAALKKCLELDPGNLAALMSLAVSYTNESQRTKALDSLREWLRQNPKYSSIVPSGLDALAATKAFISSMVMSPEDHAMVRDLYLRAAQLSPDQLDPDVQVGLGVLFNLSNEFDKAVDCFSAALATRPEDAMLWNKLGATLANGSRSEEAIHAYRKALELVPGFTRSRYNLGISCINLKAYREAMEHFLTALNLQRQAKPPQGAPREGAKSQMSESIWSTLRMTLTLMGRSELVTLVEGRDLDRLMTEFGLSDHGHT